MPMKIIGEVFKAAHNIGESVGIDEPIFGNIGDVLVENTLFDKIPDAFDAFTPDIPTPTIPDPVAQNSTLGAAQAEERSLINRAGLAETKKVRTLLGKEQALGAS